MSSISILQKYWFRKTRIDLLFPNSWDVEYCTMAADKWKKLSDSEIKRQIENPIGCKKLEQISKNKKEVAILFDDMTRPTKPYRVIPHILKKLMYAGIKKEKIRFILSSGSHGVHRLDDFQKKLGKEIVKNYPIYNHNCYEHTRFVGKTKTGIPLYINEEFMKCDLKIGIGSILPHLYMGFSGGGKIVVPGISDIRTINKFHSLKSKEGCLAEQNQNQMLKTIYEAVRMTNFTFKIDFIYNTKGEEVACFAGDPISEFKKAVPIAKTAYRTTHYRDYDVIIANAYSKSNEADLALINTARLLNSKMGILVLVTQNPQGQINHYLFRSYGEYLGGKQFKIRTFLKDHIKYIIFSSFKEYNAFDTFDKPERLIWKKSWDSILKIIKKNFSKPKIAVFPDATIQLL